MSLSQAHRLRGSSLRRVVPSVWTTAVVSLYRLYSSRSTSPISAPMQFHSLTLFTFTAESSPRQNEKCDIAIVILQLLNWHFENPNATTFRLNQLFRGLKGPVSNIEVEILGLIEHSFLTEQPLLLRHHFNANRHLNEGAYIGTGNDEFADSWIVFKQAYHDDVVVFLQSREAS